MITIKISINTSKTTNKSKKSKEYKCKWESKMNLSLRIKFNMPLRKYLEKNSKIIKGWKILKQANGMNSKTYLMNMIEFTLSNTTLKLIKVF